MKTQQSQRFFSQGLKTLVFVLTTFTAGTASAEVFTADFNGDGLEDMVVGVPKQDVNGRRDAGAVDVFYHRSSTTGLHGYPRKQLHQDTPAVIGGAENYDRFGAAVAVGDFNGDTYDDLAIGVPGEDIPAFATDTGAVNVLYGTPTGLEATDNQLLSLELVTFNYLRDPNTAAFGAALAAGDYNRDGYTDLAVGAPGADVLYGRRGYNDAGAVVVFFGSPTGFIEMPSQDITRVRFLSQRLSQVPGQIRAGNQFGTTLLAHDLSHDLCDELIIGSPYEDVNGRVNAGAVSVLDCYPGQPFPYGSRYIVDAGIEAYDHFGRSLAVGYFNTDTYLDLAIGHPAEDYFGEDAGMVTVLYGASNGITNNARREFWHQNSSGVPGEQEDDDAFGMSLAAADFDADGLDDLAIGIPREDTEGFQPYTYGDSLVGRVVVLHGTSRGLKVKSGRVRDWDRNSVGVLYSRESSQYFGSALGIGDFNNDHIADLIVGVPGHDMTMTDGTVRSRAGMAHVLYGSTAGLSTLPELGRQTFLERPDPAQPIPAETYDFFGSVLP